MGLIELAIDDLRCIERAELELHPGQNLIWGGNGSGKTSLLEAIFLLGRGRSFRTRNSERLIRYGRERLVVFGRVAASDGRAMDSSRVGRTADPYPMAALDEPNHCDPEDAMSREQERRAGRHAPDRDHQARYSSAAKGGYEAHSSSGAGRDRETRGSPTTEDDYRTQGSSAAEAGQRPRGASAAEDDCQIRGSSTTEDGYPTWGSIAPEGDPRTLSSSATGSNHQAWGAPAGTADRQARGSLAADGTSGAMFGPVTPQALPTQALGIQVSRNDGTVARISGATARSLTELTQVFPVQVIDPGIHKLLEEGGHRRRRWLDWGVFHVEHQFGDWWVRYARIVKQRNAALRVQPSQAAVWDPELVRLGELIAEARRRFVEALLPLWRTCVLELSGLEPELHYFKGWAQDTALAEALESSRARDQAKGLTHPGPHRADVIVRLHGRPAREVLSRGQQKLVAVAMTLAQLHLLQVATQTTPTLLLDDPAAELDGDHLRRFIEQVMRLKSQLVLTSLHPDSQLFCTPDRVFHVEQGRVQAGYAV